MVGISPTIYRARNPETTKRLKKVSKKSPKRSLGPPDDFDYFLDFSDFFRNFLGVRGRGVPNSSRETFLRLFGISGFPAL